MQEEVVTAKKAFLNQLQSIKDYDDLVKRLDNQDTKEKMVFAYKRLLED